MLAEAGSAIRARVVGVLTLAALALCADGFGPAAAAVDGHLFQQDQCGGCHLAAEGGRAFLNPRAMRRDVSALCLTCHEAQRTGTGHRVGMRASMRVPEDFPLDADGRLTCATCHDPHAVLAPVPNLLRRPPGRAFCELCHAGGLPRGEQPLVAVTFPPEGSVIAPGETVIAGRVESRAVGEVSILTGGAAVLAQVVDGAFAARVRLAAGPRSIVILAGSQRATARFTVREGDGAWRPHLTADTAQCGACHADWARRGFVVRAAPAESCYGCHARLDRLEHAHAPVRLGECAACHDPHGGGPGLVRAAPRGEVCLRCHDAAGAAPHILAANAGSRTPTAACTGCHDPHASTRAALTTSARGSLAVTLELDAPEPEPDRGGAGVALRGFRLSDDPGRPELPERIVPVAVPPGADERTAALRVVSADEERLPGRYDVRPAPPAAAWAGGQPLQDWGRGRTVRGGRDRDVYDADDAWPRRAVELERGGAAGDLGIVRVAFHPLRFTPRAGTLDFTRRAVVEVTFEPRKEPRPRARAVGAPAPPAAGLGLANATRIPAWASVPAAAGEAAGAAAEPVQAAAADYLIVTTRALLASSSALGPFAEHKRSLGFAVRFVTEDDFGDATGQARAHAVRRWLAANYRALGTRFVLLVGDPSPGTGDLPMLLAWPRRGATSNPRYVDAPTDAYFSDLTGNWDADGDGYYGEFAGDGGSGGVDFVPEVFVGRIPVYGGDVATLDAVLQKTIAYESDPGDLGWRRSVLLPMSFSDASTDGAWLGERMKADYLAARGFSAWTLYQQGSAGGPRSTFASDGELRGGAAEARWSLSPPGVVAWWGHGSASRAAIGYTDAWDGDILAAPVSSLDDAAPAFVFQTSCLNGYPEYAENLGYALLRRGAVATVSASRVSWYYVGQQSFAGSATNAGLGYRYVSGLTSGEPAGEALALSRGDPSLSAGSDTMWMNLMDFNLYGDPAVGLFRGPLLRSAPGAAELTAVAGETDPLPFGLVLSSSGPSLGFSALPQAAWLAAAPLEGATPATVGLTASPAGLEAGEHAATILVQGTGAGNSPLSIPVTLRILRPGQVGGRVTARGGRAIAGATVTLRGPRSRVVSTDAAGAYRFDLLPPGAYRVTVSGTGFTFRPASTAVGLGEGAAATCNFTGGTLSLRGRVVEGGSGRPFPRAEVRLLTRSGILLRRVTARADGIFLIRRIPPGAYRLRAACRGWTFRSVGVRLVNRSIRDLLLAGRR